jgi:hypothetical protein
MSALVAFLGTVLGGVGYAGHTGETPLPLELELREIAPTPSDLTETDPDSFLRITWVLAPPIEEETASAPSVFRWPELRIPTADDRLKRQNEEKWEGTYPDRLELGYARIQKLEDEPRFMPAMARLVFGIPTGLIEALTFRLVPDTVVANDKLVFDQDSASEDYAAILGRSLMTAEMKFYASIPRSYLWKFGAQMGSEDLDSRRLNRFEVRAFFSGMKNAYRERFGIPGLDLDTVMSTFTTGDWVDFFIVPVAVSLYAARFGVDRKLRITDEFRIDLQVERGARFVKVLTSRHAGRLVGASLNLFKIPASAIVSFSADGGSHVGVEFVGIGTDLSTAICMLYNHQGSRDLQIRKD